MSRMNKILRVCVGLPRSGKSTLIKRIEQGVIVNPDSIRLALHGQRYVQEAEPYVWAIAQTMVKSLFLAGNPLIYLDATNTTVKRRKMWISDEWESRVFLMLTSKEECKMRAIKAGDHEIVPVIERMASQFEEVTKSEGFTTITRIAENS